MSHPRSLDEQKAIDAEQWFQEYERVGTFTAKARALGVTPHTLRDAIRRVRGLDTKPMRRKLSGLELAQHIVSATFHVEHAENGEQQTEGADGA